MIHLHAPHRAPHDQAVSPPLSLPYSVYSSIICRWGNSPAWSAGLGLVCARPRGIRQSPQCCNIDNNSYTSVLISDAVLKIPNLRNHTGRRSKDRFEDAGSAHPGVLAGLHGWRKGCVAPRRAVPRHGQLLGRTNCCGKSGQRRLALTPVT